MAQSPLDALNRVLESGTPDAMLPHLAPGARAWDNRTGAEVDAAELLHRAPNLHRRLADVRVEVVRRGRFEHGLFQQFVLTGTAPDTGERVASHRCVIMVMEDGLVHRIEEYLDAAIRQAPATSVDR